MPRTKGSKNKNINTAKNKNVININVGSSVSKKGRGRPRKQNANSNAQTRYPNYGGGNANAPPQVIISQPQPDNNSSALSSFIASRVLNESMNSNKSNLLSVEPTLREQPSYFNARESIIPKLPETPTQNKIINEVKPPLASSQSTIQQAIKPAIAKKEELTPYETDYQKEKEKVIANLTGSIKKRYEKASKAELAAFEKEYREGFDDVYNGSTIISKSLQDTKKKDDLMKRVREQTSLLKKRNKKKNLMVKYKRD